MQTFRDALRLLWTETDATITRRLAVAFACVILSAALTAAAPVAFKLAIDTLTGARASTLPPLLWIAAYALALWLARAAGELRTFTHGTAEQRLHRRVSLRVAAHALRLPLHFHLARKPGEIDRTLEQGLRGYEIILRHLLYTVFPVLLELAAVCLILWQLGHPVYLAILALSAVAYAVIYSVGAMRSGAAAREVSAARIEAGALLTDGLSNIEPIKSFRALRWFLRLFGQGLERTESYFHRYYRRRTTTGQLAALVFGASVAAALWRAVDDVQRGSMSLGDLVLINAYLFRLTMPLEQLGNAARDLSQGFAYLDRLLALMRETPEPETGAEPMMSPLRGQVAFHDVTFTYPGTSRPVLWNVSFNVEPGSIVAIVGGSGSGKSTLAKLLLRAYEPDSGSIEIDGIPLPAIPREQLSRYVVTVPQDTVLLHTSIRANITLGSQIEDAELRRVLRLAQLDRFIGDLPEGLETIVGTRGLRLSGGQRQRVVIARAFIPQAAIVICDEPTASLDPETAREIEPALLNMARQQTTILITHQLSAAAAADCILVLEGGEVIEQGTHADLMARDGRYAQLWRLAQREEGFAGCGVGAGSSGEVIARRASRSLPASG